MLAKNSCVTFGGRRHTPLWVLRWQVVPSTNESGSGGWHLRIKMPMISVSVSCCLSAWLRRLRLTVASLVGRKCQGSRGTLREPYRRIYLNHTVRLLWHLYAPAICGQPNPWRNPDNQFVSGTRVQEPRYRPAR